MNCLRRLMPMGMLLRQLNSKGQPFRCLSVSPILKVTVSTSTWNFINSNSLSQTLHHSTLSLFLSI